MNPFCEEHTPAVLMLSKKRSYTIRVDPDTGKVVKGYSRFWECPRCRKRIRR